MVFLQKSYKNPLTNITELIIIDEDMDALKYFKYRKGHRIDKGRAEIISSLPNLGMTQPQTKFTDVQNYDGKQQQRKEEVREETLVLKIHWLE